MPTLIRPILTLLAATSLAACMDGKSDYVEIQGGGFIFNYRIAETTAGFVARPLKAIPAGATLEARFENPAGGPPIVLSRPVRPEETTYLFTTPPLLGVKANQGYAVALLVRGSDGKELQRVDKTFRSEVDQSIMPTQPLTIGPGDMKNPDASPP